MNMLALLAYRLR